MKGNFLFFLVLIGTAILSILSGCLSPFSWGTPVSEVTDLGSIPPNDPAYVLKLFEDQETLDALEKFMSIFEGSKFASKTWRTFLKSPENEEESSEVLEVLGKIIDWCEECKPDVIDKSKTYLQRIEDLLKRSNKYDYCVEVKGEAKEKILEKLNESNGDQLFFDFRDALFIGTLLRAMVLVYEAKDFFEDLKENVTMISNGQFLTDSFGDFLDSPSPDTFSSLPGSDNKFDMRDAFVEKFLKFEDFGVIVRHTDRLVCYFKELYDFEVKKTDSSGYRKDGKRTLYQLFFKAEDISFVRKTGDQTLIPPEEIPEDMTVKIGDLEITKDTKLIDVLKKVDTALPSGKITIEVNGTVRNGIMVSVTLEVDFSKVAKEPFDFKNNNLVIGGGFFTGDTFEQIGKLLLGDTSVLPDLLQRLDKHSEFFSVETTDEMMKINVEIVVEGGAITLDGRVEVPM